MLAQTAYAFHAASAGVRCLRRGSSNRIDRRCRPRRLVSISFQIFVIVSDMIDHFTAVQRREMLDLGAHRHRRGTILVIGRRLCGHS